MLLVKGVSVSARHAKKRISEPIGWKRLCFFLPRISAVEERRGRGGGEKGEPRSAVKLESQLHFIRRSGQYNEYGLIQEDELKYKVRQRDLNFRRRQRHLKNSISSKETGTFAV